MSGESKELTGTEAHDKIDRITGLSSKEAAETTEAAAKAVIENEAKEKLKERFGNGESSVAAEVLEPIKPKEQEEKTLDQLFEDPDSRGKLDAVFGPTYTGKGEAGWTNASKLLKAAGIPTGPKSTPELWEQARGIYNRQRENMIKGSERLQAVPKPDEVIHLGSANEPIADSGQPQAGDMLDWLMEEGNDQNQLKEPTSSAPTTAVGPAIESVVPMTDEEIEKARRNIAVDSLNRPLPNITIEPKTGNGEPQAWEIGPNGERKPIQVDIVDESEDQSSSQRAQPEPEPTNTTQQQASSETGAGTTSRVDLSNEEPISDDVRDLYLNLARDPEYRRNNQERYESVVRPRLERVGVRFDASGNPIETGSTNNSSTQSERTNRETGSGGETKKGSARTNYEKVLDNYRQGKVAAERVAGTLARMNDDILKADDPELLDEYNQTVDGLRRLCLGVRTPIEAARRLRMRSILEHRDYGDLKVVDPTSPGQRDMLDAVNEFLGEETYRAFLGEKEFRTALTTVRNFWKENDDVLSNLIAGFDKEAEKRPRLNLDGVEVSTFDKMREVPWSVRGTNELTYSEAMSKAIQLLMEVSRDEARRGQGPFDGKTENIDTWCDLLMDGKFQVSFSGLDDGDKLMVRDLIGNAIDVMRLFGYGGLYNKTGSTQAYGDQMGLLYNFEELVYLKKNSLYSKVWTNLGNGGGNFFRNARFAETLPEFVNKLGTRGTRATPVIDGEVNVRVHDMLLAGRFHEIRWAELGNVFERYASAIASGGRVADVLMKAYSKPDSAWFTEFALQKLSKDVETYTKALFDDPTLANPAAITFLENMKYGLAASFCDAKMPSRQLNTVAGIWNAAAYLAFYDRLEKAGFLKGNSLKALKKYTGVHLGNPAGMAAANFAAANQTPDVK